MSSDKWDARFLDLARLVSTWSKDPSTKCGAVIVDHNKVVVGMGFNGFSRKMLDNEQMYMNRDEKYSRVIHAEMNAILQASRPVVGMTLYVWPFLTCDRCAVHLIQAGIAEIVAPVYTEMARLIRWEPTFQKARAYYLEAGVTVKEIKPEDGGPSNG